MDNIIFEKRFVPFYVDLRLNIFRVFTFLEESLANVYN